LPFVRNSGPGKQAGGQASRQRIGKTRVPNYVWTFLALLSGRAAGGLLPGPLAPVVTATGALIRFIVAVVPVLILVALSPAVATLVRRGLAGRFAGAVVIWYVGTSVLAGAMALLASAHAGPPQFEILDLGTLGGELANAGPKASTTMA